MPRYVRQRLKFPGVRQVVKLKRTSTALDSGEIAVEECYFLTSMSSDELPPDALLRVIRSHWEIENCLHHVLDRSWNEDGQRSHSHRSGMNLKLLRAMALNTIRTIFPHEKKFSMPQLALRLLLNPDKAIAAMNGNQP